MAKSDSDQLRANEAFNESTRPESKLSEQFMSSSSLALLVSSGSSEYYSCEDAPEDMPTSEEQLSELSLADSELEESVPTLGDENCSSIV